MKLGQVNNILRKKRGSAATHLASYNMLAAWVVHVRKIDPEGTYILEAESTIDEAGVQQWRFVYLFAGPSATQKVTPFVASCFVLFQSLCFYKHCVLLETLSSGGFIAIFPPSLRYPVFGPSPSTTIQVQQHFEEIGTIDCAHLRVVTQGQMCTLTSCDANKEIMPMCFATFPTETGINWEKFLKHIFLLHRHFRLIVSDGSKGLESVAHLFRAYGITSISVSLCPPHKPPLITPMHSNF
jgi:hypothetical protein